ncbi:MAG: hypothetical protein HZB61_16110 [Nitrospirae bacterium]|nr:hypothetical protein [Nitrospirota bacterium]
MAILKTTFSKVIIVIAGFFLLSGFESPKKPALTIVPPLTIDSLTSDKIAPQTVRTAIRWTVQAAGGTGPRTYEFHTLKDKVDKLVRAGESPSWEWKPGKDGLYKVKVVVRDSAGNTTDSGWSDEYEIAPELLIKETIFDKPPPQAAKTTVVRWTVKAAGGAGDRTYEFHTFKDKVDKVAQTGASYTWDWKPGKDGLYKVKVVVRDSAGNTADSGWSDEYEIAPELQIKETVFDKGPPQAAMAATIRWTVKAAGGVGDHSYEFHTLKDTEDKVVQTGASSFWDWKPDKEGHYKVKAVVRDALGNTVDSGWSEEYEIAPEYRVNELAPDKRSPQAAMTAIKWSILATGGAGPRIYEFHILEDNDDKVVQTGASSSWDWKPEKAGHYKVKVIVRDIFGNTMDSGWSAEYEVAPELLVQGTIFNKPPPQAAMTTTIQWTVRATGGVGAHTYEFHTLKDNDDKIVQTGASSVWEWKPDKEGHYVVKVVVRDALGNTADSGWSADYEIKPELLIKETVFDKPPPQTVEMTTIQWTVKATGGVGAHTYEFHMLKDNDDKIVQTGASSVWEWKPEKAGHYKVKVMARDALGNTADSGWSAGYEIRELIYAMLAALPIENLSGTKAPVRKIGQTYKDILKNKGLNILDDEALEGFMTKHRVRYIGALDIETAGNFKKELGIDAVLVTSLELYDESYPPKLAIISRLVSTGTIPEIMWMDSAVLSGDDSPGILGLGLIEDPRTLLEKTLQKLSLSLTAYLSGPGKRVDDREIKTSLLPKIFYRSPLLSSDMKYKIVVMPFINKSERKSAGDIMALHFAEQLGRVETFDVVEPGLIRQNLLSLRIIMNEGLSFENAGLIFSTLDVDADLIVTGTVLDYQDYQGTEGAPKVDFSIVVIEKKSREVVCTSKSYARGDDGVFFFDKGKINAAHAMASGMTKAVAEMMLREQ